MNQQNGLKRPKKKYYFITTETTDSDTLKHVICQPQKPLTETRGKYLVL